MVRLRGFAGAGLHAREDRVLGGARTFVWMRLVARMTCMTFQSCDVGSL